MLSVYSFYAELQSSKCIHGNCMLVIYNTAQVMKVVGENGYSAMNKKGIH